MPNSVEVPDLLIAPHFLRDVISEFRAAMNRVANERWAEIARVDALKEELASIDTLEAFNERFDEMRDDQSTKVIDKRVLMDVADSHGLVLDTENMVFVSKEQAVEDVTEQGHPEDPEPDGVENPPEDQEGFYAEDADEQPAMTV